MASEHHDTRTVTALRLGTKICLMVAVPFLVAAVYFFFAPVVMGKSGGGVFECGSASSQPSDQFQRTICGNLPQINLYRAYAAAAAAIGIAVLGFVFFGVDRVEQQRRDGGRPRFSLADPEADAISAPAPAAERPSRRRRWEDDEDEDVQS